LLLAALLVSLLDQHHQPDVHQERPAVHLVVNQVTPPPPPVPFFQGNTLDVANEIATRRRPWQDLSFVAAPPAVLLDGAAQG